ncbi:hypothetical protein NPIL_300071 [Nephila pilipes]|uniref:Uncharacterized protein n=1 Tax=Nephila pilipes TaxID=299642 RepID=A0A8X6PSV4_NEPPI|nr:hypothetical protein NPIL_300071 [Nephila pilipes]
MAYLTKDRKAELRYIAEKLGERVNDHLKIIRLKNLITNSNNYEEEFVREMLNGRIQERMKASTSRACESNDTSEGHNSNPFKLRRILKCNAKEDYKIEIAENIIENMENLLPSVRSDED